MGRRKGRGIAAAKAEARRRVRLPKARAWLRSFEGGDVVRAYRNHFDLHLRTVFLDLEALGVEIPERWWKTRDRLLREADPSRAWDPPDSDDTFAFIAGYTEGGFAYGITWEEAAALEASSSDAAAWTDDFDEEAEAERWGSIEDAEEEPPRRVFSPGDDDIPF
jgi:hypothetical protein